MELSSEAKSGWNLLISILQDVALNELSFE
jgi:hypothetical protein